MKYIMAIIASNHKIRIIIGMAYLGPIVVILSVDDFLILSKFLVPMIIPVLSLVEGLGIRHFSDADVIHSLTKSRF